jgi:hypothetical protein
MLRQLNAQLIADKVRMFRRMVERTVKNVLGEDHIAVTRVKTTRDTTRLLSLI